MDREKLAVVFCIALLLLLHPYPAGAARQSSESGLIGSWQCRGGGGTPTLVFESQDRLVYNGEATRYRLVPGAIRVPGDYGPVDYKYSLKGNNLSVIFPDGSQMKCLRAAAAKTPAGRQAETGPGSGSGNAQLRGMLCSWSGSSSSYSGSSYSSATRVVFDGNGGFRYSSESSFSGSAGQAYGGRPANSGRYRVSGNTVYLTFSDGSTVTARVNMRQNDGRITELMYGKQLYATGLCN